jgi:predicted  nucleic acid-binding Zn-ribbon protein
VEVEKVTTEEIAVKFEDHEHEIKSLKHRVGKCEEQQSTLNKLVSAVDVLAVNMKHMADEQKSQREHIEKLEKEPVEDFKHYKRLVVGCVIRTVIGAIVGAVLATFL